MRREPVTFVIMAGGKGERLWPLVREGLPKVCLSPDGTRSLIQQTIDRLRLVAPRARWLIVTTRGQEGAIRRVLTGRRNLRLLVEPMGRGTAACIALAALAVAQHRPRGLMAVVPADHWMGDVPAFRRAMRAALDAAARQDRLVTIGVSPTWAHPGLGYLCGGATAGRRHGCAVRRVDCFIEKPSRTTARALLRRPHTCWNSGMFIGRAEAFLERITAWLPEHARRLAPLAGAVGRRGTAPGLAPAYRRLQAVSFDTGVMQHLRDTLVVEGRFGWEDLGSWDTWARLGRRASTTVLIDSDRVQVIGEPDHLVAAIGVGPLLVVQTPRATLLCRPDRTQEVRQVVARLAGDARLATYV